MDFESLRRDRSAGAVIPLRPRPADFRAGGFRRRWVAGHCRTARCFLLQLCSIRTKLRNGRLFLFSAGTEVAIRTRAWGSFRGPPFVHHPAQSKLLQLAGREKSSARQSVRAWLNGQGFKIGPGSHLSTMFSRPKSRIVERFHEKKKCRAAVSVSNVDSRRAGASVRDPSGVPQIDEKIVRNSFSPC